MEPGAFFDTLATAGITRFAGVPCSNLGSLINEAYRRDAYTPFTNEGDAVAFAAGQRLGGARCAVLLQNSGLTNALSPLSSLTELFGVPVLLLIGNRGGEDDEPQHKLMGEMTPKLLDLLRIPHFAVDAPAEQWLPLLAKQSVALLVPKKAFAKVAPPALPQQKGPTRYQALQSIVENCGDAPLLATTGFTSRELHCIQDRPANFYMVGSMGCVSSLALGLAETLPGKPVIAIDGDGAAMMRMGALVTLAQTAPDNLMYVVLDNGCYESTGAQPATARGSMLEAAMQSMCPTRLPRSSGGLAQLVASFCKAPRRYTPVYLPIRTGSLENLPRPDRTYILEQAPRFEKAVQP